MKSAGVDKLVFSSTAAVYGTPKKVPILESHAKNLLDWTPTPAFSSLEAILKSAWDWYKKNGFSPKHQKNADID
jgi:UDP-glucose 4-epimerase